MPFIPTNVAQLAALPQYAGGASHFGSMDPDLSMDSTTPVVMQHFVQLPVLAT